ncbi:T9SS type A sorting domain-containing protein [Bacteroidota bacterium]
MKKIVGLIITVLFLSQLTAQNIEWDWAIQGGGVSWDHGYAIAVDHDNNVLIRGKFVGTGFFGDTSIFTSLQEEDYLAKYTDEGTLLWVKKIGGKASWQKDRSIAIDEENNIYLTGYFNAPADFDQISLNPAGDYDGYIAKLNEEGVYQWVKAIGGYGWDVGYGITYSSGKVVVTGYFSDTISFGTETLISKGGSDLYLACFSPNGKELWISCGGGNGDDMGAALASDEEFVYLAGNFSGNADFDGISLSGTGSDDFLLAKYDLNGSILWAVNDASSGTIESKSIVIGSNGIYLTGKFSGSITFGSYNLKAIGVSDAYLVKYTNEGVVAWVDLFSGDYGNEGNSIAYQNGHIYTTGIYGYTISIGDTVLNCVSNADSYITCHDEDGGFLWTESMGSQSGSNYLISNTVATDNEGNIFLGGEFSGAATLGDSTMNPVGSFDMFLAKLEDKTIPSSINEVNSMLELIVYPNPNNGLFRLQSNDPIPQIVHLIDHNGKAILSKEYTPGEQLDIRNQAPGIYYLISENASNQVVKIDYLGK